MPYAANGTISQSPIEGGIEITPAQYSEALAGMTQGLVVSIEGGFSVSGPVEPEPEPEPEPTPEPTLEETAISAMNRMNAAYQAEMNEILRAYPDAETLTWDKQEQEARAWQAWNVSGESSGEPATPLLAAIAQGRSMSKAEIVTRVLAKADAWMDASGYATGKRQAKEDRINEALANEDRETLESISW